MSSRGSIVDRLMASGMSSKSLRLNTTYVAFLVLALGLTAFFAYSTFNTTQYGQLWAKFLFCLTAILAGVTGHLLQGPFQVFSVILFFAVYNFFVAHYNHFSTPVSTAAIQAAMKSSAEILFWSLLFFGLIYLVFVFFPQINAIIPTAEEAYKMMKRGNMSAPKQAAPAPVAAPAPTA